ncbi:MAG: hypothetical protein HKO48_04995 [Nitrosopumilus sp.]|nr:hypothetical protein [Nitrosopumilus sp.]NNL37211.1 hypothetical protein [Nitrosopumilus sp.]NNM36453.1 hypothetical protein [Nitrosopumilus sp.]
MKDKEEIQKLIDEINFRKSNSKNYEKMKAVEISKELRDIMKFEQESFKKIEEFEKTEKNQELVQYAKMISKNTTGREIANIQEIYLKKIDEEFLNSG